MSEKNNKVWSRVRLSVIFVVLFAVGFYFGGQNPVQAGNFSNTISIDSGRSDTVTIPSDISKDDVDFSLYWKVFQSLKDGYVDHSKIKDKDLFYGSIKGLVAAVGDPYTVFMDPKDSKKFSDDLSGSFEGIGAEIGLRDDILTVVAPIADMPAAKAGIKAGDQIYSINGTSTAGMGLGEAVTLIRGQKGTPVTLSIFRKGFQKVQDIKVVRDTIVIKSVKTEMRKDGFMTITITAFNNDTVDLFNKAVKEVLDKKPKGIILDLRNNPGGYLDAAVSVSSEWIDKGPIVLEKQSDGTQIDQQSNGRGRLKDYKTVVLVDGGSASASEILAGALRDYGKAKLVGEKTYGKGSVQGIQELSDGSTLKMTVAKWFTPKGTSINEQGIQPDYKVEVKLEDIKQNKDTQFDKALEIIKGLLAPAKAPVKK